MDRPWPACRLGQKVPKIWDIKITIDELGSIFQCFPLDNRAPPLLIASPNSSNMASRRIISPLLLPLLLSSLSLSDARLQTRCNNNTTATTPAATCQVLYNTYPDLTSFPNETQYTTINEGTHLLPPVYLAPGSRDGTSQSRLAQQSLQDQDNHVLTSELLPQATSPLQNGSALPASSRQPALSSCHLA